MKTFIGAMQACNGAMWNCTESMQVRNGAMMHVIGIMTVVIGAMTYVIDINAAKFYFIIIKSIKKRGKHDKKQVNVSFHYVRQGDLAPLSTSIVDAMAENVAKGEELILRGTKKYYSCTVRVHY